MLDKIVELSVKNRVTIAILSILLLVFGAFVLKGSKMDVFPNFAPPIVSIQTRAPGLSPVQVEQLVTRPIENAVNGVPNLETVRSNSMQGMSLVTAIFRRGSAILPARQLVAERLSDISRDLPAVAEPPTMEPLTSATSLVLEVGLRSSAMNLSALRSFADFTLKPRLLSVPGVAKVVIYGGNVQELQIQLDPKRLKEYGMSFGEVVQATHHISEVRGAGFISTGPQRINIVSQGQLLTPEKLAQTVIRRSQGLSVKLSDVATVTYGSEPQTGAGQVMGQKGVVLLVSEQYKANTLDVTQGVEKALRDMAPIFKAQQIKVNPDLFRPADFITTALKNVQSSLLIGGLLVILVLFLFLWNPNISLISFCAIPLSLVSAVIILHWLGISLNTMSIGGLAIALGEVVDDAIIDVENIFRRLRENQQSEKPKASLPIVINASLEVRHAVVFATFIVILVFYPVITMGGLQGSLFAPLGMAYVFAVLASLVVAITFTPALSALTLKGKALKRGEPAWIYRLKHKYEGWLERLLDQWKKLTVISAILTIGCLCLLISFGGSFLPDFNENNLIVHMTMLPGTSLNESLRLGGRVGKALLAIPEVKSVDQIVGTAKDSDDVLGPFASEIHLRLKKHLDEDVDVVGEKIRKQLSKFPGAQFSMNSFLSERIDEVLSGSVSDVAVKIFGSHLNSLKEASSKVAEILSKTRGSSDVNRQTPPDLPQVKVDLNLNEISKLGFKPKHILETIQTAYEGDVVAQTYDGNQVVNVRAILDPKDRTDPSQIENLSIRNDDGKWSKIKDLADVQMGVGPYSIAHEGAERVSVVTCNVRGRDVVSFTDEIKRKIDDMNLPPQTYVEVTGAAQARAQATQSIYLKFALALSVIVLLLWVALGSLNQLILVLVNLPFALVGGVLAVFFGGGLLSLGAVVGFVTLFGITTRNSLMLISHCRHLVEAEGGLWSRATVIRAAKERLLPILMTATVTALGLLPLALGADTAGREIEGPMAIVILGGLITSTALNLLVLPTLIYRFGDFDRRERTVMENAKA